MGTRGLTRGPCHLRCAQIALGRLGDRQLRCRIDEERARLLANLDHANGLVGATVRTRRAANARAVIDSHRAGVEVASNRASGAANHADRIDAMQTGIGDHDVILRRPLPNESWVAVVCGRTGPHTIVAARATIEIDQHRLGAVQEAMIGEEVE